MPPQLVKNVAAEIDRFGKKSIGETVGQLEKRKRAIQP